jgi:hypothetical protein
MLLPVGDMDPNLVVPIDDFGNDTLLQLVERLEESTRFQHYIAREAELDDVWRHVEAAIKGAEIDSADGPAIAQLRRLLDAVMAAHDLVAGGAADEAARRLRAVMAG